MQYAHQSLVLPFLLAALPALSLGGDTPEAGAENELAVYDLKPLRASFDEDQDWFHSLVMSPSTRWSEDEEISGHSMHTAGDASILADLLAQALGEQLRFEGRQLELLNEGELLVVAPSEVHKQVGELLAGLSQAIVGDVGLRVDILDYEGVIGEWPAGVVIDDSDVDRLIGAAVARGASHRSAEVSLSAGRTDVIDQTTGHTLLTDYDVEIAQGSFVFDPIVIDVREGVRMVLHGVPTTDGVQLSGILQDASLVGDVRGRALDMAGQVAGGEQTGSIIRQGPDLIQTADIMSRATVFNALLPQGKALVCASRLTLGGQTRTQVIYISKLRGSGGVMTSMPIQGTNRSLIAVNAEGIVLPSVSVDGPGEQDNDWVLGGRPRYNASLRNNTDLFLFDWIRYRFSVWRRFGPWVLVVTDPAWDGGAAQELEHLIAGLKHSPEVLAVSGRLHSEGGSSTIPVEFLLPARPGTSCGVQLGITSLELIDYDVEVAQFSAVADPKIEHVFKGLSMGIGVSTLADGRFSIDLKGDAQVGPGGFDQGLDVEDLFFRHFDLPRVDTLVFEGQRRLKGGETVSLGVRASSGDRKSLRAEFGVR